MSSDKLPQSVTVKKLVDSGASLSGSVSPDRLPRLAEAVVNLSDAFAVQLDFGKREDYKSKIDVQINGAVDMQCQRCLLSVSAPIDVNTTLVVVAHDEEAKSRIRDCEPIVLDAGMLDIDAMIEEEVLLALPLIAMHESACNDLLDQRRTSIELDPDNKLNKQHSDNTATAKTDVPSDTLDDIDTINSIKRRSEAGMDNPFDVLKTLKTGVGQEQQ